MRRFFIRFLIHIGRMPNYTGLSDRLASRMAVWSTSAPLTETRFIGCACYLLLVFVTVPQLNQRGIASDSTQKQSKVLDSLCVQDFVQKIVLKFNRVSSNSASEMPGAPHVCYLKRMQRHLQFNLDKIFYATWHDISQELHRADDAIRKPSPDYEIFCASDTELQHGCILVFSALHRHVNHDFHCRESIKYR